MQQPNTPTPATPEALAAHQLTTLIEQRRIRDHQRGWNDYTMQRDWPNHYSHAYVDGRRDAAGNHK